MWGEASHCGPGHRAGEWCSGGGRGLGAAGRSARDLPAGPEVRLQAPWRGRLPSLVGELRAQVLQPEIPRLQRRAGAGAEVKTKQKQAKPKTEQLITDTHFFPALSAYIPPPHHQKL